MPASQQKREEMAAFDTKVAKLRAQGITQLAIADRLGCSIGAICRAINRLKQKADAQ